MMMMMMTEEEGSSCRHQEEEEGERGDQIQMRRMNLDAESEMNHQSLLSLNTSVQQCQSCKERRTNWQPL